MSTGRGSANDQSAAPACAPSHALGERLDGAEAQQDKQAAKREAGQQSAAACTGKRPRGAQQGASSKQLKLQRTLRELDVDPSSSSLTLSASEWLSAQPVKTRQQALAGQQLRKLRGRQIPVPGRASSAAGSKGRAGSGVLAASSPPPSIALAERGQHTQAKDATAGAQEIAEAAAEHASGDEEAVQQQSVSEYQARKTVNFQEPAQPAEQAAPPHMEPQKGSRELNSLLSSALAMPGHQASSLPLRRQSAGKTRADSAPQPGTSEAPVSKRKKASTGELAKLLEAAAKVAPKDASSAPLHLQAQGRTRAQSTPKHSASEKPLSPRQDRKPNRELARLLHAAAEVAPKDASSAPLCLGATRTAKIRSQQQASMEVIVPAPVQAQAEASPWPKPKSMRGLRELAALHNGLFRQAPSQPRRRHAVKLQQAETAGQGPVLTNLVPAAAEKADEAKTKPPSSRERQWAASGQPTGQPGSRAAHRQTRRAGQLAAVQGGGIAKRTRQRDRSLGGHALMASSGRQTSSKPHVKQTARKQTGGKPVLIAHKAVARKLATGPLKHCGTAEGQGSVASQGAGDPQLPNEAAARRSKRAAAGGRLRQVLKRVKNPIQAARAELMQSRAAQVNLLRQRTPGRAALRPMPIEKTLSPSSGTASIWGASQRRSREASRGVQRLVDAYKLPWNALRSSAGGKRPQQSVDSARPSKRLRSDQQPDRAEMQHRSAAAAPMPGRVFEMPSMEQGSGVPVVHAPGLPAMPSMQHSWSLPAPQVDTDRFLRPQQAFTVIGLSVPEPLPRSPGPAAVRHAAYAARGGGTAAPCIAAADAARSLLRERSGVLQRSKTQRAAGASMPDNSGQDAPAPGRPGAPKQMRQTTGPGRGMHVPAHVHSQPAGDRPHSKRAQAGQPSTLPQAGAPNSACKAAETHTDATSPQGKASQNYLQFEAEMMLISLRRVIEHMNHARKSAHMIDGTMSKCV